VVFPHTAKSKVPVVGSGNTRVKLIKAYLANTLIPPHRKPALPLVFASDLPGITAFPGVVAGVSLYHLFIMYTYLFRFRLFGWWFFGVRYQQCSFSIRLSTFGGIRDFYLRVLWYELFISELPF